VRRIFGDDCARMCMRGRASSGDFSCVIGLDGDVTGDGVGEGSAYFKYATYSLQQLRL